MSTLRFRTADATLPTSAIVPLRRITNLSIAEIKQRAANGEAILEITPFENDWEETRSLLVQVAREMEAGKLPLTVAEVDDAEEESPVSLEMLKNLIQHYREIELQTECNTMLELGEISDPSEFEPEDEDWTNPQ